MTAKRTRLFTPGPVEIPERILRVLGQAPPHHRTDGFRETLKRVTEKLRWIHGTEGEQTVSVGSHYFHVPARARVPEADVGVGQRGVYRVESGAADGGKGVRTRARQHVGPLR